MARNALTEALGYVQRLKDQAGGLASNISNYFNPQVGVNTTKQFASPVPTKQVQTPQIRSFWSDIQPVFKQPTPTPQQVANVQAFQQRQQQNQPLDVRLANTGIGQSLNRYAMNQFVNPLVQGVQGFQQGKTKTEKALGALPAVGAALQALPGSQIPMTAYNLLSGAAAGTARSARTGQELTQSIYQGATEPTSFASQGLGVENPFLALGVDIVAGNPKGTIKSLKNVNSLTKNLTREKLYQSDIKFVREAIGKISTGIPNPTDFAKLEQTAEVFRKNYNLTGIKEWKKLGLDEKYRMIASKLTDVYNTDYAGKKPILQGLVNQENKVPNQTINEGGIKKAIETESSIRNNVAKIQQDFLDGKITMEQRKVLADKEFARSTPLNQGVKGKSVPQEVLQPKNKVSQGQNILTPDQLTSVKAPVTTLADDPLMNYNTSRMGVDDVAKQKTLDVIRSESVQDILAKDVGPKLSFKEVKSGAKVSPELGRTFTRDDAVVMGEQALALRNKVAEMSKLGLSDDQFQEVLIRDKAFGTYIARLLGQRRIISSPEDKTIFNKIIGAILKKGHDPEDVIKAAKGVDFENPEQTTKFYRTFIKASKEDWIDALRYNSMLSSPLTHITNISSNAQGTGIVAPIEKTITGGIDFLRSKIDSKYERQYFAGEGLEYAKGYYTNLGNAARKFADVMKGNALSDMQELHNIPLTTGGTGRKVENTLGVFSKLLQAEDEFFRVLTSSGAKKALEYKVGKGGKAPNIETLASQEARKRLFNAPFNLPEEGNVLKAIEFIPQQVMRARASDNPIIRTVAKYTFPFVRIPANILKANVEYSPAGLTTLWGAKNKTEQLSKAVMGTSIALGTATLLASDRLTWAEPADQTKKSAYRNAGLQPYSVKIGDKWVSYAKLHPVVGFNLALVASLRDAEQNKRLDETQLETVLNGLAKWVNYYADASYVKNIGDMVSSAKGDAEGIARFLGNYPQQFIPLRAMLGWITRIVDPVQRQADPNGNILQKQLQQISAQIPGLSSIVPARTDSQGNPVVNQNRFINALSPAKVTTENPEAKQEYLKLQDKSRETKLNNDLRSRAESTGKTQVENNKVYYSVKSGNKTEVKSIDLTQPLPGFETKYGVESTGSKVLKDSQFFNPNSSITKDEAVKILKDLKADPKVSYALAQKSIAEAQKSDMRTAYKIKQALNSIPREKWDAYFKDLKDRGYLTPEVIKYIK